MAAYKDEERGTWYVSFHYYDWTGKNKRKLKRGFKTRREALEWEQHFRMKEEANLEMTFDDFVEAYTRDMKPKLKENTWNTKEAVINSKILPYFKDKKMKDINTVCNVTVTQIMNTNSFYSSFLSSTIHLMMEVAF
ncbi:Arm DNA-binding domain-containing protein [Kineothrix sp. MB12-C1]|uniref:Arm DNA-binding domain-containing protein n=1 Tax=Kineothrix sp. MB12-C1 TaxID=3070215 RepID=UPI0027D32B5A|nr:Arm DNA-binding domain-containing protein [Kineothrix sp. MB12-C1]WMC94014.1 Arm DNA-binding domain-containing protein [Kineothrix sp. MB12-C1]